MKFVKGWAFPDYEKHFIGAVETYPQTSYQDPILQEAIRIAGNTVAVDIGANIGLQTVRLAQAFSEVHAFEPVLGNWECLLENTRNIGNVTPHCCGISDKVEELEICLPESSTNSGAWSIVDFQSQSGVKTVSSDFMPLDAILHDTSMDIDLIKIDVQGYEMSVLRGSEEILRRNSPVVLIEMHQNTDEITTFLHEAGYTLHKRINKDGVWSK